MKGSEGIYNSSNLVSKVIYHYKAGSTSPQDNVTYTYTYTNKLLTRTNSATGVVTNYVYNANRLPTQIKITATGSTAALQSDTVYNGNTSMPSSVTGNDRNTVLYNYDTDRAQLTSVTDPLGNVMSYTYDVLGRPLTTTAGSAVLTYCYADDRLNTITHTGDTNTTYTFTYGTAGLLGSVTVGNQYTLSTSTYTPGTWTLSSQSYGNGDVWKYSYNEFDAVTSRYTETAEGVGVEFKYFYNSEGSLARIEKYSVTIADGIITGRILEHMERCYYDRFDRPSRVVETDGNGNIIHQYGWEYDYNDNVTSRTETVNDRTTAYTYAYDLDQRPVSASCGTAAKSFTYDGFGRLTNTAVGSALSTGYTYRDVSTTFTTTQVSQLTNTHNGVTDTLSYTYDANGNILSVSDGVYTTSYTYDSLNQLLWEYNQAAGKAWQYSYDTGGNIQTRTEYDYTQATGEWTVSGGTTTTYTYGDDQWGDLLTAYNGTAISYDGLGNPEVWQGWSFSWQGGRQLGGMSKGETTLTFAYNDSGLRTEKTVTEGGVATTHEYIYTGSQLMADITDTDALYFHYDQTGDAIGFTHLVNGTETEYYYRKNLQGDVLGVLDASGTEVAAYSYDAWGNILSATGSNTALANRNPLRYRGYQYDTETSLYYLTTRYYDPELGRFINPDGYTSTGQGIFGGNMFACCLNNPVEYYDPSGKIVYENQYQCKTTVCRLCRHGRDGNLLCPGSGRG